MREVDVDQAFDRRSHRFRKPPQQLGLEALALVGHHQRLVKACQVPADQAIGTQLGHVARTAGRSVGLGQQQAQAIAQGQQGRFGLEAAVFLAPA